MSIHFICVKKWLYRRYLSVSIGHLSSDHLPSDLLPIHWSKPDPIDTLHGWFCMLVNNWLIEHDGFYCAITIILSQILDSNFDQFMIHKSG